MRLQATRQVQRVFTSCVLDWGCWAVGQLYEAHEAEGQQLIYDCTQDISIISGAHSILAARACAGYIRVGATLMPLAPVKKAC
jgi:hypothetical protein